MEVTANKTTVERNAETELDKVIAMLQYAKQHARDGVKYAAKNVA